MYSGNNGCILAKWLYSGKKGLQSGKSAGIREKEVVFDQKWLDSAQVFVYGQKLLYSGKCGCIRAKIVLFGQSGCIWAKVVVFGQKWFY